MNTPQITLAKAEPHHDPNLQAHVMIQGRILLERTAFVGHSFIDDDADVVEFFKNLLQEVSVKSITGERAEANSISQKVKDRIIQAEIFIGILTRREEISVGHWRTSEWVLEERTHAAALGKRVILLKEKGVQLSAGLQGDAEYIEFDRQQLHKASIKLIQMIWSLNPGKMAFNKQGAATIGVELLEAAIAAQPNEPMLRVQLAQVRSGHGQVDAVFRELRRALELFPNLAPARLELAKGLRTIGRIEESKSELVTMLASNPLDSAAHHQMGHILEQQGKVGEARAAFQKAQDCNPGDWGNYRCHAQMLFRNAGKDRSRLIEARDLFAVAVEVGGENAEKQCKSFIDAVGRKIRQSPPQRTIEKRLAKKKKPNGR